MAGSSASRVATLVLGLSLLTYIVVAGDIWLKSLAPNLRKIVEGTTNETLSEQWSWQP
jgi:hypothetical protein